MSALPVLTVRALRARAVSVPIKRPLKTSSGALSVAPLVLLDLETEQGVTGRTYLFCYTPLALEPVRRLLADLGAVLAGEDAAPLALDRSLRARFRLLGAKGVVGMALAGIDMAAWDALARARGLPLVRALGAAPRPVPAYNSGGLGMIGAERAAHEAEELLAPGFRALKVRLGYPELATDLAVLRSVRRAAGDDVPLMADYNQSLSVPEAARRVRALDDEGPCWVEEPTLADDYEGHAAVRAAARTAIQLGENWCGPEEMASCLRAGASDLGMPDAMKIGGVTGWLRAAALAASAGMPLSSHLFPEVSVHLLAATPTCHWLEHVDWAEPVLAAPLAVRDGHASAGEAPGTGIDWDEPAVQRYLVR